MRSLRFRLAAIAALIMLLTAAALSVALLTTMRSALLREVDDANTNQALDYSENVLVLEDLEFERQPLDLETIFVVIDATGTVLTGNDDDIDPAEFVSQLDLAAVEFPDTAVSSLSLSPTENTVGEQAMRAAWTSLVLEDSDTPTWAIVAQSIADIERTTTVLRNGLLAAAPLLAAIVGLLTWWLTGRSLRPVDVMRQDVDRITSRSLNQRISLDAADDEISRLGETMNGMLDRLERGQQRQQQFVSDAAHELRTPLASMAAQLDVDAEHPTVADPHLTAQHLRSEVTRLQNMVEALLALARSDQSAGKSGSETLLDLDDLVVEAAQRIPRDDQSPQLVIDAETGAVVRGNSPALERIVENLVANALRHAATEVAVSVRVGVGPGVVVVVDDDGPGVPPEDRDQVFERFVRLDDARARDAGGSGLGLALSREIARTHAGTLTAEDNASGGGRFVLRLPLES